METKRKKNTRDVVRSDDVMDNILKCVIFFILCTRPTDGKFTNDTTPRDFVDRCRRDCVIKRDVVVCGKYRVVRWLHEVVREKEFSYGPFKVIRIPAVTRDSVLPDLPRPRDLKFGIGETLSFMKDVGEDLITRRAIVYTYQPPLENSRTFADGPIIMDEDEMVSLQRGQPESFRLFKKKKAIILPILILLNLMKLKMMLIPIIFGVHMIKKLIVIGGLFVPGFLSRLKICKVAPPPSYQAWANAVAEPPVDYPTDWFFKVSDMMSLVGLTGMT
ncbi:uncharacterized protein LOC107039377 isoform X2 [Diachasma alloeum]|uniref:uncharacterized protein LOC107039377 isoform X2 n=1 Tax=Diachasma alloeum TaxID=454923 RepID=UPI00073812E5|nr:uncharacterized protein LOC107039377 isoform X2 [Diachasma alloeum]